MSSQRPFFFSTFFSAIRQQQHHPAQQPNKHTTTPSATAATNTQTPSSPASASRAASAQPQNTPPNTSQQQQQQVQQAQPRTTSGGVVGQRPTLHSPRGGIPIPNPANRRRGSDSSSEGFREVLGADKWYVGGRTATGEERYFKLGVVKRVRSNDGFSLDRLSL